MKKDFVLSCVINISMGNRQQNKTTLITITTEGILILQHNVLEKIAIETLAEGGRGEGLNKIKVRVKTDVWMSPNKKK